MNGTIRIPTILGLGILFFGLVLGVFAVSQNQIRLTRASGIYDPKGITVANVSATSVSIYWKTESEAPGYVQYGTSSQMEQTSSDERDSGTPQPHKLHLITIRGLTPNTQYYYKVKSGPTLYPSNQPLTFTTTSENPNQTNAPIIGTVIDTSNTPVKEALIELNIDGAQKLAAITKTSGNFIIPLAGILDETLAKPFDLSTSTPATLTVSDSTTSSLITLTIPYGKSTLPPITLGQNETINQPTSTPLPTPEGPQYDLNDDGGVNSFDLNIVLKNRGNNPKDPRADLNKDGVVDQKDIELMSDKIKSGR
jgi:hypothetical protein